jgi:hypothetical protein
MTCGTDYAVMEGYDKVADCVPHDKIGNVISRLEALKAANANTQHFATMG